MEILATIWTVTYGVLLVILGFNALIIVHEFGHFAVARLCGVRCEKFYIWFDFWGLKFFKFKWGNTEYGLGLFPLGGYLKMLGQEDNPGAIQAEIERARAANEPRTLESETGADGRRQTADGREKAADREPATVSPDSIFAPDSYLSKNVPQRLAIIVAGVVMNFLFAIICAAGAYMIGVEEITPAVGNVIPGSPAWIAGLQTGDRITAIDSKPARAFNDINVKMVGGNKTIQLDIVRQNEALTFAVAPRKRAGDLAPNIGIGSLPTLELATGSLNPFDKKFFDAQSLAALQLHSVTNPLRIEKVDGQVVENYAEYQDAQLKRIGLPIFCVLNGTDVALPAIPMREIPVQFKMGQIVSVLPGSDAAKQGIVPGDTIVSVDDADVDPLKLPQILLQKVNAEQKNVELVIKKASGEEQTVSVELAPTRTLPELLGMSMRDPLGSNALGLSWNVEPIIENVMSLAYAAGSVNSSVNPGDKVVGVEFVNCASPFTKRVSFSKKTEEGYSVSDIGTKIDIPYIFTVLLQAAQPNKSKEGEEEKTLSVRLSLMSQEGNMRIADMPILESTDWFQTERGLALKSDISISKATGIGEALSLGMGKTVYYAKFIYSTLDGLINGRVSAKAMSGPVGIVEFLYKIAQENWVAYLLLLCMIGANLAVINLLPIPPLDGGHIVFLTYEGIFRRPPNELVQVILSYLGLFLIILLMLWTLAIDLSWITRW